MAEPRWYIVHVYSGFEHKVADQIREQAAQKGLSPLIAEVLVPTEEVVEVRRGKRVAAERKFFPGYVLVKMVLNDETWSLVKNIPKVTGFLGPGGKPSPVPEAEAERVRQQMQQRVEQPRPTIEFVPGDRVRVTDGPFATFEGVVEEVDEAKGRLKVSVSIFGRATPVELEYSQVERV
jgi:transcriptional antiterminator NusG